MMAGKKNRNDHKKHHKRHQRAPVSEGSQCVPSDSRKLENEIDSESSICFIYDLMNATEKMPQTPKKRIGLPATETPKMTKITAVMRHEFSQ